MLEPLGNAPRDASRSLITLSMRRSTAIAIAVSLLVHVLLIVVVVNKRIDTGAPASRSGPLVARLQPPPRAAAPAVQAEPPAATPPVPAPPRTPPPRRPPVITQSRPAPRSAPPAVFPPLPPPVPTPPDNNPSTDMAANMRARQAAREGRETREGPGEAADAAPAGSAGNEVALRNLQSLQKPGVSGIFTITRMGTREGEFIFNGWTTDARNSKRQFFTVDAGVGGNLELAMVREMIKLIRQYYKGDFKFDSHRLNRVVTLSARVEDSSGLEDFLRLEFFGRPR